MNLILEKSPQMPFPTDMHLVFSALPGVCESHDWLITDCDGSGIPEQLLGQDGRPVLIPGHALQSLLNKHALQFYWVFYCALLPGTIPDLHEIPWADGNPAFWHGSPKPQLKESIFEIVCWDSSATLLIGVSDKIASQFRIRFPETRRFGRLA